MKRLGYILMVAGVAAITFGVGSLIYPMLQTSRGAQETSDFYSDSDADLRPIIIWQRIIFGVGGGTSVVLIGAYIYKLPQRKDGRDTA